MKTIALSNGKSTYVDKEDFGELSRHRWYELNGYAATSIKGKTVYMHRIIMNCPEGFNIDHLNHNRLDNRKVNLRLCNQHQNNGNYRLSRHNTSGYKGVGFHKKSEKWRAYIQVSGRKQRHLGLFPTSALAAKAYDEAALGVFGDFAKLNFEIGG